MLLLCALAGLALALALAWPQRPVYQAHALVELQSYNENFWNLREVDAVNEQHGLETGYFQTQIRLLQSDALLDRVARRLQLASRPEFQPHELKWWQKIAAAVRLDSAPPAADPRALVRYMARRLQVRQVGETHILEIAYDSEDAQTASEVANTIAQEFINLNLERRVQLARQTSAWLADQIHDLRANLERSENALQDYTRHTGIVFTAPDRDTVAEARLRQLQDALSKAQEDRVQAEARYERTRSSPAEAIPEVQDDQGLRNIQQRLTDLRRHLAELSATYTPNYYKVKEAKAQVAELESQLDRGRSDILRRVRTQFDSAMARERSLAAMYQQQSSVVAQQSDKSVRYNMLKREVDSNRQIYEAMLQKVKEAGIASGIRSSNIQIVDPAAAPPRPYKPSYPLYGGVGLFCGLLFGVGLVLVRKRNEVVIQTPGDLNLHLRLPELGAIPAATNHALPGSRSLRLLRGGAADEHRVELAMWQHKDSPLSESFRAALASVLFSGQKGEFPKAVVISSSLPGEGKTVVASNFAIALAQTNHRVLLVDGDLRRPRLHKIFNLSNQRGFSDLLREDTPCEKYPVEQLCEPTEIPGLSVLPAGPDAASATHFVYSRRAAEILDRLRSEFDHLIIDTPPLSLADARGLGRMADGVALVIRADQTSPETAAAALRRLADDGTWVLGTILNSWDMRKAPDHPYAHYSNYKPAY